MLAISILLFICSLSQTAYCTQQGCRPGYDAFVCGALLGFLTGAGAITWLANPFLLAAWIWSIKQPVLSLTTSLISTLIALSFFAVYKKAGDNEAGSVNLILSYGPGYWLWLSSQVVMLAWNAVVYFKTQRRLHQQGQ